jgi:hypothetical protein
MPKELTDRIDQIEDWVKANEKEVKRDRLKFWGLKLPAILSSSASAAIPFFESNWGAVIAIAGTISIICVLLDGLTRPGKLLNVHLRAVHELRKLENDIKDEWEKGYLKGEDHNLLTAKIIESVQTERNKVGDYIKKAEAIENTEPG